MKSDEMCANLEDIALKMTSSLNLSEVLARITQGLVDQFDASFARIWLLGPGDLCKQCHQASICSDHEKCLHLKASSGIYTNLNGEYRRFPLSEIKLLQTLEWAMLRAVGPEDLVDYGRAIPTTVAPGNIVNWPKEQVA